MENKTREEIISQIITLRDQYARLRSSCTPQGINKATIIEYTSELKKLQAKLKE